MPLRVALVLLLFVVSSFSAAVPTPKEHLGFAPGDDLKLADYADVAGYFQKLAKASDRIKLVEFGKSSEGRAMYAAFISAPENLAKLEHYKEINRKLALGLVPPAEAARLAKEGKAFVWIDSGLHATEVAPAQQAPELAYKMITAESDEVRRIRQNVILIQIPVINPDGLDMVAHWYRKNVGTPHELAALPWLYQKYAGHDNNRDWFMLNLPETRQVTRLLFAEWFPQIVYNQHQQPAFPARIFVPPYADPLNPNIPAAVMEGINQIGSTMAERFAREDKPGVLSYFGFDGWWNGGLRAVPAFHNMHGIMTETAASGYGTPRTYEAKDFPERFSNGMPTKEPGIFYQRPWMGGRWSVRDAIEYMLTADFAILDLAATRAQHFLSKAYDLAHAARETTQKPYAYVVPMQQWDRSSAVEMVRRMALAGVEVQRAKSAFEANGKSYPEGTLVMLGAQPFRPYLIDLMEVQKYPEIRVGTSGPTKRPYDIAGWTLSMNMGVSVERIEDAFTAKLEPAGTLGTPTASLDHRENASFLATAELLGRDAKVRWAADGNILVEGTTPAEEFAKGAWELRKPRVALYEPWTANIDTGWMQWLLDTYKVPHTLLHNEEFKAPLNGRFDTIVLASQSVTSILNGARPLSGRSAAEKTPSNAQQRAEFSGGIGGAGLSKLLEFVEQGGTLIAIDSAADLPAQKFPLPVTGLLKLSSAAMDGPPDAAATEAGYYCPGSLLRITVDNTNPIAFGMPANAFVFASGGQAWDINLLPELNKGEREIRSVAKYAKESLLASGWLSGEKIVLGKHILLDARYGKGRVVLFGFRPHFRGQTFGTFKLLLNALYLGSAVKL